MLGFAGFLLLCLDFLLQFMEKSGLILRGFPWFSSMVVVIILNEGQLSHWVGTREK